MGLNTILKISVLLAIPTIAFSQTVTNQKLAEVDIFMVGTL